MFNIKQLSFYLLLVLLLIACGGSQRRPVGGSPYYPSPGGAGGIGAGAPSGVAVMVTNSMSINVTRMQMNIFGTQGQSAAIQYSGPARFQGSITFSQTCSNQYSYPNNRAYPHQPYPQYSGGQQQCPAAGADIRFNCQGRIYNEGNFECQANLYGSNHLIRGGLSQKRTTSQDYEIIGVEVKGPCMPPCF